jgi:hypothetical protein
MTWEAARDLEGEPDVLKVSASDLETHSSCERHLAVKVRPFARPKDWKRRFPPDKHATPFPLRDVIDVTVTATRTAPMDDYEGLERWLRAEIDARSPSRLVRPYLDQAVRNALDAHAAIEAELGPLDLVALNPEIGPPERRLTVWAPLYATSDGVVEIRRFRLGSAKPDTSDTEWARAAAWVAASYPSDPPPNRVRVVEIGLADASIEVCVDVPWDDARAMLDPVRPRLQVIANGVDARPGRQCGSCKIAGACDGLPHASGLLGVDRPGHQTRSVSASALEVYRQCPSRWLLSTELHLPRADDRSDAQVRGMRVHEWLDTAHRRGQACRHTDLPNPDEGMGLAQDLMTRDEYELAFPMLLAHVDVCALSEPDAALVGSEHLFLAYDEVADVVVACQPDLVTERHGTLVLTEVKTSMHAGPESLDDAFGQTLQVPLMLNLLAKVWAPSQGYRRGEVRLEYLTPSGARLWTWCTDDAADVARAESAMRTASEGWHVDHDWTPRPGAHCAWCPVREWCPDRDVYLHPLGAAGAQSRPAVAADEDLPPF